MGAGFGNFMATGLGGGAFFLGALAQPVKKPTRANRQTLVIKRDKITRNILLEEGLWVPGLGKSVDVMINISIAAAKT
jgi:hypothetical protein